MKKILIITFLLFSSLSWAEPFKAPKIEADKPLEIRSEKVDIYRKKNEIHFMNHVKAVQGEMTILSKKMIVKYSEDKNSKVSINKISVEEGANLFTNDIKASGNLGEYDFKKGIVSLKGDVIANEKGAMAYGEEFIYNVKTKKTKLLGNKNKDDRVIIILDDIEKLEERVNESKKQK